MIFKSFQAENSSAAIKLVKAAMGKEAVIIDTVQTTDSLNNKKIEILGCLTNPSVAQLSELLEDAAQQKISIVKTETSIKENSIDAPPIFRAGDRIAVIGIAGSGKSSVIAKLAAELVVGNKAKVSLLSLGDLHRAAQDEISLIDTPALTADEKHLDQLWLKLAALELTHCFAVVSALTVDADLENYAGLINQFNPSHLIITMTDLVDDNKIYTNAQKIINANIAFTTNSPGGIGRLNRFVPEVITIEKNRIENTETAVPQNRLQSDFSFKNEKTNNNTAYAEIKE